MKTGLILYIVFFIFSRLAFEASGSIRRSVAIVVDKETYANCSPSIESYAGSLSLDGLSSVLVIDKWGLPDSIRAELLKFYKTNHLEGAVFIGDIPVPMIRNAHHLSSAFKMDPRRPWPDSSVPSDRFYDDFDLKFDYLKQDSVFPLFHYYSLAYDGPQEISCDIYSARIKPPVIPGKTKFQSISEYLLKVAKEKRNRQIMGQISYFAGHSYNSGCMVARIDEKYALMEQFPFLKNPARSINYIDYTYDDNVKHRLLAELARKDLDLAVLHHHGAEDEQLMNGSPISSSTQVWIDQSKKFFRGKIRGAKDTTASKQYYIDNYNVPASWVNDAFNPEVMLKDSLADAGLNIFIPDLYSYESGAKMIVLDACFNGSFHLDDYIGGHYIFNPGSTIVVKANSVNTLQDIWPDQLMGLLNLGVSVGNWAKGQLALENHLIGDPTFRFVDGSDGNTDLDEAIVLKKGDVKFWRKLMKNPHPEVKSLAMKMLFMNGAITTDELLSIQKEETRWTVRLMAFNLIKNAADNNLLPSIKLGLYDNYELIRRFSALTASESGSPLLIDDLFTLRFQPGVSKRVGFHLKSATENYGKEEALAAFDRAFQGKQGSWYPEQAKQLSSLKYALESANKDFNALLDPQITDKAKKFTITALRNSCDATHLDLLVRYYKGLTNQEQKVTLIEAFGWFKHSWKKNEIVNFCRDELKAEKNEAVKHELVRTLIRLNNNSN